MVLASREHAEAAILVELVELIPLLAEQLERCLEIQFLRHVDFGACLLKPNELARNAKIQQWLAPCADTFGWDRRMQSE